MPLVVFLRGVNVGGHKTFRPTTLVAQLKHLDAVNIGAAGTLVIRRPITQTQLRSELLRRLPFHTEIMICSGTDILRLMSQQHLVDQSADRDTVYFVSVLSKRPQLTPSTPMAFPATGQWLLKILSRDNRFVFGVYRRHMKAIRYLGTLDRLFGVPATTRNWNTFTAIAKVLASTVKMTPAKSTLHEHRRQATARAQDARRKLPRGRAR
jgi:uncharacterized protein (DUF1697 family)